MHGFRILGHIMLDSLDWNRRDDSEKKTLERPRYALLGQNVLDFKR